MRSATIERKTGETQILLSLNVDGTGIFSGSSGIGFFDHMLQLFSRHGSFDLAVSVAGDLAVDTHHTLEDLAIVLGDALTEALGNRAGIRRYGMFYCPMDEVLTRVVIDLSGRPYLVCDVTVRAERIGDFETEMLYDFLYAFAVHGGMNLHIANLYGSNSHHIVESVFKALGHALREAVYDDGSGVILSTTGVL